MLDSLKTTLLLGSCTVMLLACSDSPSAPTLEPQFAKGKPAPTPQYVLLEWDDAFTVTAGDQVLSAGVRGDGRTASGAAGASAYQGGQCGVAAHLVPGTEVHFDLYTATTCGAPRLMYVYIGGPNAAPKAVANKSIFRDVESLAVGESRMDTPTGFTVNEPSCTRAMFADDYAALGSSNPVRTRLPDLPNGARQWRIESRGAHTPVCTYTDKRNRTLVGATLPPMPFAVTITEVK